MVIEVKGIIEFEPENKTRKHAEQSEWKRVVMIRVDDDTSAYYAWFLKRRFNLELNKPLRGTHVTFISDKFNDKKYEEAKRMFDGAPITFYHEIEPCSNGEHWWLRVHCEDAENIREFLGLARNPYFGMHLTLGRAEEKYPEGAEENNNYVMKVKKDFVEHSHYILSVCEQLYGKTTKQPLETHDVFSPEMIERIGKKFQSSFNSFDQEQRDWTPK
jgi:hypothetical protein